MQFCCAHKHHEQNDLAEQANLFPTVDCTPDDIRAATLELRRAITFQKINADGTILERKLILDRDNSRLTYFPSNKLSTDTTIYIKEIVSVLSADYPEVPKTEPFRRAKHRGAAALGHMACFAIVHKRDARGEDYKTMNLAFLEDEEMEEQLKGEREEQAGFAIKNDAQDEEKPVSVAVLLRNRYMQTISFLAQKAQKEKVADPEQMELLHLWLRADADGDKRLSLSEIKVLLRDLQVELDSTVLKEKFNAADDDNTGYLGFKEFKKFYNELTERREVRPIFMRFAEKRIDPDDGALLRKEQFEEKYHGLDQWNVAEKEKNVVAADDAEDGRQEGLAMNAGDLAEFMRRSQCDHLNAEDARAMVRSIARDTRAKALSLTQFTRFIMSRQNTWYKPHHKSRHHQNMRYPLHNYYISTSNNTMLTGNQVESRCASDKYREALERGARSVEIHVWDGVDDGGIYVSHGVGAKIRFEDVCKTINQHAFRSKNLYPVIIFLHVYTRDVRQQSFIARICNDVFRKRLLVPPVDHDRFSPEELKEKILIVCRPAGGDSTGGPDQACPEASMSIEQPPFLHGDLSPDASLIRGKAPGKRKQIADDDEKEEDDLVKNLKRKHFNARAGAGDSRRGIPLKLPPTQSELQNIIALHHTARWRRGGNEEFAALSRLPHQVASYSEGQCERLLEDLPGNVFARAQKFSLSRVYPRGTDTKKGVDDRRVFSDNFMPHTFWCQGVSCVALNFQRLDYPMRVYSAFFEANGGSGYILKPRHLRDKNCEEEPPKRAYTLRVRILSGSQLPRVAQSRGTRKSGRDASAGDVVDPYVALWVYGARQDCSEKPRRTERVDNNGFNPVWDEAFDFQIECLEHALLTLRVLDSNEDEVDEGNRKDEAVAEAIIPIASLRLGYRSVQLRQLGGPRHGHMTAHGCLLCHFALKEVGSTPYSAGAPSHTTAVTHPMSFQPPHHGGSEAASSPRGAGVPPLMDASRRGPGHVDPHASTPSGGRRSEDNV